MKKLKGPKGTKVAVTIEREGVPGQLEFTIVRGKIPTSSVPYYFMLTETIGYIRLTRFAGTTAAEMSEGIDALRKQGMSELVLDLRYNGGGLLKQAIYVSDMFLDEGLPIVSTVGRLQEANIVSYASSRTKLPHPPIIVLIDEGTASGSEIVSGAIQDMDRGLIIGTQSFGKGLVQTVFQLPEDWTLVLTTQRYHTPSGRCIQKPYSKYARFTGDQKESGDSEKIYKSQSGRELRGGGGIHPDVVVEYATTSTLFRNLQRKNIFTLFGLHYAALHRDLPRDFEITGEILEDFVQFAADNGVETTPEELVKKRKEFVETYIKFRIVRSLWGNTEAAIVYAKVDDHVQRAIELMPEAKRMLDEVYLPFIKNNRKQHEQPAQEGAASIPESSDVAA